MKNVLLLLCVFSFARPAVAQTQEVIAQMTAKGGMVGKYRLIQERSDSFGCDPKDIDLLISSYHNGGIRMVESGCVQSKYSPCDAYENLHFLPIRNSTTKLKETSYEDLYSVSTASATKVTYLETTKPEFYQRCDVSPYRDIHSVELIQEGSEKNLVYEWKLFPSPSMTPAVHRLCIYKKLN